MTEGRLAVPHTKFVEEPEAAGGLHLGQHPVGGALGSRCPLCSHTLAQFNSYRFCNCNVYSHYSCLMRRLWGTSIDDHVKCSICDAAYILYFEERAAIRPLSQCTIWRFLCVLIWMGMLALLCLILIDVFSHALDVGESYYEERSYLIFAAYTGFFVVVSLGCCMNILIEQRSTLVSMQPFQPKTEVYYVNSGEQGYDLVRSLGEPIDDSGAKVKVEQQKQAEPEAKDD